MQFKNHVRYEVRKADGTVESGVTTNLRVNAGTNWWAQVTGNAWGDVSAAGNSPRQMAVTENSAAPASGDTNLVGEESADGLSRQTATFSHTADQSLFTQTATWQYTGASTKSIAKAALAFALTDADTSADTHFTMTELGSLAVLDSNDTLEIQWGIDLG